MTRHKEAPKSVRGNKSILGNTRDKDGIDHINIHSVGGTELGRLLSHFTHQPFVHPHFGPFYSMEGFWYFARTGFNEAIAGKMRYLSGFRAKKVGCELPYVWYKDFKEDIIAANYQKIILDEHLLQLFIDSELPFDHYYTFGKDSLHITPNTADWLVEGFEAIRRALQAGVEPDAWLRAEERYTASSK